MKTQTADLEGIADSYHLNNNIPDKFIEDLYQDYCCDWLAQQLKPNDRVIELGYGEGITTRRLSAFAKDYTVIEGAPSLVDRVRKDLPNVKVVPALFEDYVPPATCDKLLALHVFEHVDDPVSLALHLKTWLSPEGEMIVIVPNKASLHRRLAVLMGIQATLETLSSRDHLVGHQRVYDLKELLSDLQAAGFLPIESRGFFLKTLPNSMMLQHSNELILAMNRLGDELPAELQANLAVRVRINR
jgi:2-polyprenyl-3-methyl-5-hydroxy-6-metoxy-1,4-benzoquinol methylase